MDYFYQIDIFFLFRIEINPPAIPADPPIHHPPRPVLSGCHPCLPPMHTRLSSQEKAYFYCGIVLFLKKVNKKSVLFENVLYHNDYAKSSQYIVVLIQRTWNILFLDSKNPPRFSGAAGENIRFSYLYCGSQLPCASIRSSTMRTMVSISSSLPVWGSSIAA